MNPNYVIERVLRGQDITLNAQPMFGDFTDIPSSYHEALNVVTRAKQNFMLLDAKLRARFDNDPGQFVEFVSNPENKDECIKLGLIEQVKPIESPAKEVAAAALAAIS